MNIAIATSKDPVRPFCLQTICLRRANNLERARVYRNLIGEKSIVSTVADDRIEVVSIPSSSIVSSVFTVHNNDVTTTTDDIEQNDGLSSYCEPAFTAC